jgi:hypothetical protein
MRFYLKVQAVGVDHIIVDDLDVQRGIKEFNELPQLRATDTIGTIDGQGSLDLDASHHLLEGIYQLLVVSQLGGLAVLVLCSKGVLAAHNVVKLRGGHVLEVDKFNLSRGQGGIQHADKPRARGTSISSKDHAGGVSHLDIDLLHQLIIDIGDLVQRGIGKLSGICLPLGLAIGGQ